MRRKSRGPLQRNSFILFMPERKVVMDLCFLWVELLVINIVKEQ